MALVDFEHIFGRSAHHLHAVIAKEHIVGNDIGAYLQLNNRVVQVGILYHGRTVTADIDRAANDGAVAGTLAPKTERGLFHVGAVVVQSLNRGLTSRNLVVEVSIIGIILQVGVVGICIRAVATAVDIASDRGTDTYGRAAPHTPRDVVTTIDVVDVAALHNDTCRQAGGDMVS